MLKRGGAVARAMVIAVAGLSFGLVGPVGPAAAQSEGAKKGDTMMKGDDKSKMMKDGQKGEGMKREDAQQEGKAAKKDDNKMKDDMMMKEKK
jgi:hypothetical protein